MHARIEQLLKALPQLDPPGSSWERIQIQLAQSQRARERRDRYRVAAIAAAVVVTLAMVLVAARIVQHDDSKSQMASEVTPTPSVAATSSASDDASHLADLVAESQHLDSLLQALPQRHIERVSTAATIDTIEERIQWLDFQLSATPEPQMSDAQARRLWRERVELMDSLVKVRYADADRASF